MKYIDARSITRDEVISALTSLDSTRTVDALIRMSLSESDWEWAERTCLIALENNEPEVKNAALIGIGHIARRFRTLHLDVVLPVVNKLRNESPHTGTADDVLDDIAMFVNAGDHHA